MDYGYDQDQLDKRKEYAMNKYIRLPNGNKIKYYSFAITNALIVKFIDTDVNAIKDFFGVRSNMERRRMLCRMERFNESTCTF